MVLALPIAGSKILRAVFQNPDSLSTPGPIPLFYFLKRARENGLPCSAFTLGVGLHPGMCSWDTLSFSPHTAKPAVTLLGALEQGKRLWKQKAQCMLRLSLYT